MTVFLIYSKKHSNRNVRLWWRENSQGYTARIKDAGRYTDQQAREICATGKDSIPVPEWFAEQFLFHV